MHPSQAKKLAMVKTMTATASLTTHGPKKAKSASLAKACANAKASGNAEQTQQGLSVQSNLDNPKPNRATAKTTTVMVKSTKIGPTKAQPVKQEPVDVTVRASKFVPRMAHNYDAPHRVEVLRLKPAMVSTTIATASSTMALSVLVRLLVAQV